MLERAAISFASLRLVGAALLLLFVARLDLATPSFAPQVQTKSAAVAADIRCTHGAMRTRAPGLQPRYFTRDLRKRRLHELVP